MKIDKIKVCILELILITFLFFILFASNIFTRMTIAIIILIYTILIHKNIKLRKTSSIFKKQVTKLMTLLAFIYLGILYLLGLYFGFVKAKVVLSLFAILRFILPISVIIISSEIIRNIFLSQKIVIRMKQKRIDLSPIFTYIAMVLIDLIIYTEVYDLTKLDDFLTVTGFVLFASLSSNLLYNYISKRYGSRGNIIFRLITVLYIYIIPIVPDIYIFFQSFLRMLYPYLIYLIIDKLFSVNDFTISYTDKKKEIVSNTIILTVITLLIMLISCQFKYGILVVGSRSMTGSINKGDAVIFEKYEHQDIVKGMVIIFDYNNIQTIHRVIDIKEVNGEYRYYTKGDANKDRDKGYTTQDKISGLVKLKIKYIGYPTIWTKQLFS